MHALRSDGLIVTGDMELAAPAHDVIEDWAVMRHIDLLAAESEWQAHAMAKHIGASPAVRRGFRGWLRERLDTDSAEADRFVLAAYGDGSLPRIFREDVLISVLLSGSVGDFVSRQKDRLLEGRRPAPRQDGAPDARGVHQNPRYVRRPDDVSVRVVGARGRGVAGIAACGGRKPRPPAAPAPLTACWDSWRTGPGEPNIRQRQPARSRPSVWRTACWRRRGATATTTSGRGFFGIIASVPGADGENFLYLVEQASSKSGWHNVLLNEFRRILTGPGGLPACRDHPKAMAKFVTSLRLTPEIGRGRSGTCALLFRI